MKKLFFVLTVLLISSLFTYSQKKEKSETLKKVEKMVSLKTWEAGFDLGIANFAGEFNMYKTARFNHFNHWNSKVNLGFGAFVKKNFSQIFALELGWNYSNLTGSWKFDSRAFPNFKTEVNVFELNTVWNMTNLLSKTKIDRKIFWYTKLGVGVTHLWEKSGVTPLNHQNWQFPTYALGTGGSYRLSDNVKLNIGTQWTWVNTDRLDGRKTDMTSGNTKPGNSEADVFGTKLYTYAGLSFTIGKKKKPEPPVQAPVEVKKPEPALAPKPVPPPPPPPPPPVVEPVKPSVVGNTYKIMFGLNFAFDKWNLDKQSSTELDRLVKDMTENPTVNVEIKSHSDSRGATAYNLLLSEKRGKAVSNYLINKGIDASRIKSQAFGETQLLNKCKDGVLCTPAEHAINRRSEATIVIPKK